VTRSKSTRTLGLAAALAVAGSMLSSAQTVALTKNIAPWVSRAQKVGAADESKQIHIVAFLSFKNQATLQQLVEDVSTPGSAKYHQFLTPEQFREAYAPDAADVKQVQDTLTDLGFRIENTPKSGLFVQASGTVGQVKSAFHVSQDLYSYNGKTLRANVEAPTLPASISKLVSYIGGLDDSGQLIKPLHRFAAHTRGPDSPPGTPFDPQPEVCSTYWGQKTAEVVLPPSPYPTTVPWFICGYTPAQLRAAYGANKVTNNGRGVRVAIADMYASPTIVNDVNTFSKRHGLPQVNYLNFEQIVPPGIYGVSPDDPCGPQSWYTEETLDVESVHTMAPNAFLFYVGASCTDLPVPEVALYGVIDNRLADIITNSWSWGPEDFVPTGLIEADNAEFMQAAAEGITVMFSSGDSGDYSPFYGIASGGWPADSPWVTAVGGTSLALENAAGEKTEWGWGSWIDFLDNPVILENGKVVTDTGLDGSFFYDAGSGGGLSFTQLQPFYQQGIVPAKLSKKTYLANGEPVPISPARRVTPDISMVGDPYTGVLIGETFTIAGTQQLDYGCTKLSATTEYCELSLGGTSASSPLFAGALALADEEGYSTGIGPAGWLNPFLYFLPVGAPGSDAPIIDVRAPKSPTAVLASFVFTPGFVSVTSMNSAPNAAGTAVVEGANADYSILTTVGYDGVTGLGTPNIPALIDSIPGAAAAKNRK